jgi:plasmid stability protein
MMYGVKRTTIYLPDDLKRRLEEVAALESRTEAEVIREALRVALDARERPRPTLPLFAEGWGDPTIAEQVDDILLASGFGRDR